MPEIRTQDRYRGCLLGLAAGDALGTTLEFRPPCTFTLVHDIVGGGPFLLEPGQWTDDTSMALCLAASLVETAGFDPVDQMDRYVRWWREGYMSSTGDCFDIGTATVHALCLYENTREPYAGSDDPSTAGNGSLMRLAPIPMYFAKDPNEAIVKAAQSSRTTHGAREAMDACRYFAGLLVGALAGAGKETLLSPDYSSLDGQWDVDPLTGTIAEIAQGSFKRRNPPGCFYLETLPSLTSHLSEEALSALNTEQTDQDGPIRGKGHVVRSLEAALWAFHRSANFRDGALLAVNLGDDADTTGAIYGQIAGAFYGVQGIPQEWMAKLTMRETITSLADGLHNQANL